MGDSMTFPDTIEEFLEGYSFIDKKEYYTNGTKLIPVFRVEQALEHYYPTTEKSFLQKQSTELCPFRKITSAYYSEMNNTQWTEEEFAPCIKEKCRAYYEKNLGFSTCFMVPFCKLMD